MRIIEYAKNLNANSEIVWWLEHTGAAAIKKNLINENDLEHIIDWMCSERALLRLKKMSLIDARKKTNQWVEKNIFKGSKLSECSEDVEEYINFSNGFKFVKLLTKNSFQREGHLMSHCLGGYSPSGELKIYSLRDLKNNPHCTIEVRGGKEINQIKGKGNGNIHPKYINYVLDFLDKMGMKIRPKEMKNLGFYHIDKSHVEFIKKIGLDHQMICIKDEFYAY